MKNILNGFVDLFSSSKTQGMSVIAKGSQFNGDIVSDYIFVDGMLTTNVLAGKTVHVGKSGSIHGKLSANTIEIMGTVDGDITCDSLVLHPGSVVKGDIVYKNSVQLDPGAQYEGTLKKYAGALDRVKD